LQRVLKPGGRALTTWFLLEDDARGFIADGRSGLAFLDPEEQVAVLSEDMPEEAVAYDEGWVYDHVSRHGLSIVEPVHPGSWCGVRPTARFRTSSSWRRTHEAIDVRHLGRERVIAAYLVDGSLVDCGPASALDGLLAGLGDQRPARLLLTHIHLDHAGAPASSSSAGPTSRCGCTSAARRT
jgi:hypothetical protein